MHISEGVLSGPVLAVGGVMALAGTAWGLRKLEAHNLPRAALLSAAFFTANLVHVPLGPSNVHLILNGLVGIMLGWAAFPALLVALALQALLFQFGGFVVLGVNTTNMALPAVVCYLLLAPLARSPNRKMVLAAGFAAGALSVGLAGVLAALSLDLSGSAFIISAQALLLAHLPVACVEGAITALILGFLHRVKPETLQDLK